MSAYFYDETILQKIRRVYSNTIIATDSDIMDKLASANNGTARFPAIVIERLGWRFAQEDFNRQSLFSGQNRLLDQTTGKVVQFPVIPITVQYQFNIIADRRQEVDQLSAELLFFLLQKPNVKFQITSPLTWTSNAAELVIDDVTEDTDFQGFTDRGRMYRTVYDFTLKGANLFQVTTYGTVQKIIVDFHFIDD
jgi:hypothetical protein